MAFKLNKPVFYLSLEMDHESIAERLATCKAGLTTDDLLNLSDGQNRRYTQALETLETSPLFVDDASTTPLAGLSARARKLHHSAPLGLIVVDYLQLINTNDADNSSTRATQVGNLSRGLKQLARELNCPVIALSQLSRSVESRPNKRPLLSDLRESGSIEQDADVVMFLYRDEYYDPHTEEPGIAEINIAKQREGKVGTVKLRFDPAVGRFYGITYQHEGGRA